MIVTYKDLHEMLPFALNAYYTTIRTSTRATPYSLVLQDKNGNVARSINLISKGIDGIRT